MTPQPPDGPVVADLLPVTVMPRWWNPYHSRAVRLESWQAIARRHVSVEVCMDLARQGFPEMARGLMRARGDL